MNKLGFAIQVISVGAQAPIVWNKEAWTSKVTDVREHIKLFDGLLGTDNFVTFLSFDEGGCFVTITRTIAGRVGDCLSGWIYIPCDLDISVDEAMDAYSFARECVLTESNISNIKPEIDEFFGKEYPKKGIYAKYEPSRGDAYALRYLKYYNMKELLKDRYQPYYANYKAVFLLDKDGEVKVANGCPIIADLTSKKLLKQAVVTPPSHNNLRECGEGTKLFIDGQEFTKPFIVYGGETKKLMLTRAGFEKQQYTYTFKEEDTKLNLPSPEILTKWKKRILASMFVVYDERGNGIGHGLKIEVNGKSVTNEGILFSEEDCKHAHVKITWKESYVPYERQQVNLLETIQPIYLKRKTKAFKSEVEMKNGEIGDMTIDSEYLPDDKSPLEGYYLYHNRLQLDSFFVWKQRLYGALIVAGIVLLVAVCSLVSNWCNEHVLVGHWPFIEKVHKGNNVSPTEVEDVGPQTWGGDEGNNDSKGESDGLSGAHAIAYMNDNEQWLEAELEKYELTKGLYAEMNQYQFDKIVSREIGNCERFEDIKMISQEMKDFNITTIGGSYSNDGSITVEKWLETVSKKKIEHEQNEQMQKNSRTTGGGRTENTRNTGSDKKANESNTGEQNGGL